MSEDNNIVRLVSNAKQEDGLPQFHYLIVTKSNDIHEVYGFPVFSAQYIMIMREFPNGQTVPVFMIPLDRVETFELDVSEDEEDLPF